MPTSAEQEELMDANNCTWIWTTQNGVNGYKVTSKKNGNSIFLPAAGFRSYANFGNVGEGGRYWSSSLYTSLSGYACYLFFHRGGIEGDHFYRFYGRSVRPVCE